MGRSVVVRSGREGSRVVGESSVPTEAELHRTLMEHPELVPATDLGAGRMVVAGFEASLASGSADLVLVDERGQLCVVEVKKEGNSDTRRVIAQLLDYAGALWGLSLEEFESRVLRSTLGAEDRRTLAEFVRDELTGDSEDGEQATADTCEALAETLRSGDFALVVAAPSIPAGVERQIEYLNARGLRVYGLEVSYFADGADAVFVPRIVVRPTDAARIVGRVSRPEVGAVDPEAYFSSLDDDRLRDTVKKFIDEVPELGGEVHWRGGGAYPRARVRGSTGAKVIISLPVSDNWSVRVGPPAGLPSEPFQRTAARLRDLGLSVGGTYATFRWREATAEMIGGFLDEARELIRTLADGPRPDAPSPHHNAVPGSARPAS